jgi:hypothetical protein
MSARWRSKSQGMEASIQKIGDVTTFYRGISSYPKGPALLSRLVSPEPLMALSWLSTLRL